MKFFVFSFLISVAGNGMQHFSCYCPDDAFHIQGNYYACEKCNSFSIHLNPAPLYTSFPLQELPPYEQASTDMQKPLETYGATALDQVLEEENFLFLPSTTSYGVEQSNAMPIFNYSSESNVMEKNQINNSSLSLDSTVTYVKEDIPFNASPKKILKEKSRPRKLKKSPAPVLDAAVYCLLTEKYAEPKNKITDGIFIVFNWNALLKQINDVVNKEKPTYVQSSRVKSLRQHFYIPRKNLRGDNFEIKVKDKAKKAFARSLGRVENRLEKKEATFDSYQKEFFFNIPDNRF